MEQSRTLIAKLAEAAKKNRVADLPVVTDTIKERLGGTAGLVEKMVKDFEKERGENLSPDERNDYVRQPAVIQRYWSMMLDLMKSTDEQANASALETLESEDIKAVLLEVAVDALKSDVNMRKVVLQQMIQEDPQFLRDVLESMGVVIAENGKVPLGVVSEVAEKVVPDDSAI